MSFLVAMTLLGVLVLKKTGFFVSVFLAVTLFVFEQHIWSAAPEQTASIQTSDSNDALSRSQRIWTLNELNPALGPTRRGSTRASLRLGEALYRSLRIWVRNESSRALGPTRRGSTSASLRAEAALERVAARPSTTPSGEERVASEVRAPLGRPGVLVGLLALVVLLSVITNVMLLRRRPRAASSPPTTVVPDLGSLADRQELNFRRLDELVGEMNDRSRAKSDELLQAFLLLRGSLSEKDAEIERLKVGYDTHLLERFAKQCLRFDRAFVHEIGIARKNRPQDQDAIDSLRDLRDQLRELLESEMNVTRFTPEIDSDINQPGIDSNYETCPTEPGKQDKTVAAIVADGWRMRRADGEDKILQKARVKVYVSAKASVSHSSEGHFE